MYFLIKIMAGIIPILGAVLIIVQLVMIGSLNAKICGFAVSAVLLAMTGHYYVHIISEEMQKDKDDSISLPAGSTLNGVFLNGIDAPTGQDARRILPLQS